MKHLKFTLEEIEAKILECCQKSEKRGKPISRGIKANCHCAFEAVSEFLDPDTISLSEVAKNVFGMNRSDFWSFISAFDGRDYEAPTYKDSPFYAMGERVAEKLGL
jgi:hypothetical protein